MPVASLQVAQAQGCAGASSRGAPLSAGGMTVSSSSFLGWLLAHLSYCTFEQSCFGFTSSSIFLFLTYHACFNPYTSRLLLSRTAFSNVSNRARTSFVSACCRVLFSGQASVRSCWAVSVPGVILPRLFVIILSPKFCNSSFDCLWKQKFFPKQRMRKTEVQRHCLEVRRC